MYWLAGIFFTLADMYGFPSWVIQFKIPDPSPTSYPVSILKFIPFEIRFL